MPFNDKGEIIRDPSKSNEPVINTDDGDNDDLYGGILGIVYIISIFIAAYIFVPQDGWVWGLIKGFFWLIVVLVKFFQWIF